MRNEEQNNHYHLRSEGRIVFSSVRLCVCLSVNAIIPEPLEMSSRNVQADKLENSYAAARESLCSFNASDVLVMGFNDHLETTLEASQDPRVECCWILGSNCDTLSHGRRDNARHPLTDHRFRLQLACIQGVL